MRIWLKIWSVMFLSFMSAHSQDIIITEIFADPTPSRGLPEVEFVEILNRTPNDIRLAGYQLVYGTTVANFPDSIIRSEQYAILVKTGDVQAMKPFGHVIALPRLSLNNNGAVLRLFNAENKEIHYVSYLFDWYTDGRNDGYSLEMIDLNTSCLGKENWASSSSKTGASPGKTNTRNGSIPSYSPPNLVSFSTGEDKVYLVFDKILEPEFVKKAFNFQVDLPNTEILGSDYLDASRESVVLQLSKIPSEDYRLFVYAPSDCLGNIGEDLEIEIKNYPNPLPDEIQISEILFRPKPGGDDFVEIYNNSHKEFNLKNWQLAHINAGGEVARYQQLSPHNLILKPGEYMAFTKNREFLTENYPYVGNVVELDNMPPYNNDSGTVLLLRPDSSIYDQFSYTEKMHSELINNTAGVSLEKVSFRKNQNRWNSASTDSGYATPGLRNSQSEDEILNQSFYSEPPVFNPFQNGESATTYLTYKLKQENNYAGIYILDKNGRRVKNLGDNILLGTSGKIPWDGTDDSGQILPVGYYVFYINVFGNNRSQKFYAKTVIGSY